MDSGAAARARGSARRLWIPTVALLVAAVVAAMVAMPGHSAGTAKVVVAGSPVGDVAVRQGANLLAGTAPSTTSTSTSVAPAPAPSTVPKATVTAPPAPARKPAAAPSPAPAKTHQSTGTPPTGLPEPACASLPPGFNRASLRGGQWLSNRVDGSTAHYSVFIEALPCDLYDNERGQMNINIGKGPPETLEWTVDYGDGTVFHNPAFELCHEPNPVTWMTQGSHDVDHPHVYANAGTYNVKVAIVVHPCDPTPGAQWPGVSTPTESVTLTIPVQRVLGPRPYPAPEIPPIVTPRPNP